MSYPGRPDIPLLPTNDLLSLSGQAAVVGPYSFFLKKTEPEVLESRIFDKALYPARLSSKRLFEVEGCTDLISENGPIKRTLIPI